MSPDSLKLNIAKYGNKHHKNFPDIETFNYFCSMDKIYNIIRTISQTSTMRLILPHRKTQKTPKQEIEKAIKLKNQYYAEKQ